MSERKVFKLRSKLGLFSYLLVFKQLRCYISFFLKCYIMWLGVPFGREKGSSKPNGPMDVNYLLVSVFDFVLLFKISTLRDCPIGLVSGMCLFLAEGVWGMVVSF